MYYIPVTILLYNNILAYIYVRNILLLYWFTILLLDIGAQIKPKLRERETVMKWITPRRTYKSMKDINQLHGYLWKWKWVNNDVMHEVSPSNNNKPRAICTISGNISSILNLKLNLISSIYDNHWHNVFWKLSIGFIKYSDIINRWHIRTNQIILGQIRLLNIFLSSVINKMQILL